MSATLNLQSAVVTIARPLVAAVVLLALTATAQAQVTSTWNGTSGDWTNPALWSTNPFYPNNGNPPGTTYAVNMGSGTGTLTMNVPITVQSMQMAFGSTKTVTGTGALTVLGQTLMNSADAVFNVPLTTGSLVLGGFNLRGSGPIAVTGSLTAFDNMLVSGSGPITVAGPFSLSGVGQLTLDGRSLTLNGANNTWTGNSLQAQNGAVFTVGSGATLTSTKTFRHVRRVYGKRHIHRR